MVNVKSEHRSAVLECLRKKTGPVSGTELGEKLGISRVAVRKHIIKLGEEGFTIESGKRGYRLMSEPDYPSPSEYDSRKVHIRNVVASTMEEASEKSMRNCEEVQFYLARRQKAGRGRNKKSWISPEGGLYLTAAFLPRLPAAYISLYIIQSGLALVDSLRNEYGVDCRFRWPNDLCVGDRKLGGLLLELSGPADTPDRALLGFGLNVRSMEEFSGIRDRSVTSLQAEIPACCREVPGIRPLFDILKPVLESSLDRIEPIKVRERWRNRTHTTETIFTIDKTDYIVRDLALNGSLIAADAGGVLYEIAAGPRIIGPV
jgi:BirA family biotin operon repressor/biotin-[acetyl-CoA-carboxylase] ligase